MIIMLFIENYLKWVNAIPLWKKLTFSIVSSILTVSINIFMALFLNTTLIIHTSNLLLIIIAIFLKKIMTLLFINKLYCNYLSYNNLPPLS